MKEFTEGTPETRLEVCAVEDIGLHYATTLRLWHEEWCKKEKQIEALDPKLYDEIFHRKWRFYFGYCEAAFAAQYIFDYQIAWIQTKSEADDKAMEGKALGLVGMTAEEEVSDYRAAVDGAGRSSSSCSSDDEVQPHKSFALSSNLLRIFSQRPTIGVALFAATIALTWPTIVASISISSYR